MAVPAVVDRAVHASSTLLAVITQRSQSWSDIAVSEDDDADRSVHRLPEGKREVTVVRYPAQKRPDAASLP